MPKDRLFELKQTHERKSGQGTSIELETVTSDNSELRKTFERAEVVGQWIEQIKKNVSNIKIYIQRVEDVKYNQKDVRDKLQGWFQNNTSIAQQISTKLKEIDSELSKNKAESARARIQLIQYDSLKKRFEQIFLENSKELENYQNIQKDTIKAQLKAKGNIQVTDDELTALLDEGQDLQIFTDNIISETAEAKRLLADVEERHQQLIQIERMLTEVKDLFVQISILVDNQQGLIDRIEYQAQAATDYVGAVDLGIVRRSKRKYLKRKIYFFIALLALVALIVALILKS